MKIFFKGVGYFLTIVIIIVISLFGYYYFSRTNPIRAAKEKMGPPVDTLSIDGLAFRDLNKNGILDPYEDRRVSTVKRVNDLLSRMSIEEKAGMMFQNFVVVGENGELAAALNPMNILPIRTALFNKKMNFFNLFDIPGVQATAKWHNTIQHLAERTRLGIPVTISSDPRHTTIKDGAAIGFYTEGFSHWTEPIGMGAIRDPELVHKFGEIAAQEYRAIGIHTALHPMVDLATEPRWGRISGTFGEDAQLTSELAAAYINGFQGDSLSSTGVATMTKHFPGGGPQKDGWDPHFTYGKDQVYPGDNSDYHIIPFKKAIEAGTVQMMPYYGVPIGLTEEEVAFGFNHEIITNILIDSLNFQGIICSDWGLLSDTELFGIEIAGAKDYGVEDLTPVGKTEKALAAGIDQFGGESSPEYVIQLVEEGKVSESRLDRSVFKLLKLKFELGLFDDPFVDVDKASRLTGTVQAMNLGYESQLRSQVLLTNKKVAGEQILPLVDGIDMYIKNLDRDVGSGFGNVVDSPGKADVAILNLPPPYEPDKGTLAGMRLFSEGRLYYTEEELRPILEVARQVPTIITTYLERPALLSKLADSTDAILANFGATDRAIFDVLFGRFSPTGKLPFEMPSSLEAVENQKEDVPFDSKNPLFPFGYGLTYESGN